MSFIVSSVKSYFELKKLTKIDKFYTEIKQISQKI